MPVVRYLIILTILPIGAFAQVVVSGRVHLCEDFFTGLTVKGKLSYVTKKATKRNYIHLLDTLQPDVIVSSGEKQILVTRTDAKGRFDIALTPDSTYHFRFKLTENLFRDTLLSIEKNPIEFSICISDSGFHNVFLRKIPFDSIRARKDLASGIVRIISLDGDQGPTGTAIIDVIGEEEVKQIEMKFGLQFDYYYLDNVFHRYREQREREYNDVVYRFLDQKLEGNSRELIRQEIRAALSRRKQSRKLDNK